MKPHKIKRILDSVQQILDQVHLDQKNQQHVIGQVNEAYRKSATNLVNYLSLRSFDLRRLQRKLGYLGMSRLARSEAHVEASLKTTLFYLKNLLGEQTAFPTAYAISIKASEKKLAKNTAALFGGIPKNRRLRIMVTIPSTAVNNYTLVEQMIAGGMDCARINCAHDSAEEWLHMIENIKKASEKLQKEVVITMDVGGPKIRTGEIESGSKIKHFNPVRNETGKVISPAIIHLVAAKKQLKEEELPVAEDWLFGLAVDDTVVFTDTRNKKRKLQVMDIWEQTVIAHCYDSAYIETGTTLEARHGTTSVGEILPIDQALFLKNDDDLVLCKKAVKGKPAQLTKEGEVLAPACVSCTIPEVLDAVEVGDPIFFDDGEIKGEIKEKRPDSVLVRIKHAKSGGTKLKADKGINFPESNLSIAGLTEKDKEDLKFIAAHADVVNFSFVHDPQDVKDMLAELEKLGVKDKLGIILKIETQKGYNNLTKILLEAMKSSRIGVMIARGDLAIEVGWERIGSIQNEMLAICNASHVPVVWATQVLENLAKKGLPSRSEITDAVNATKADCVMLNKGPYILEAIQLLHQLITSAETAQDKNAPMLPKLKKISKKGEG